MQSTGFLRIYLVKTLFSTVIKAVTLFSNLKKKLLILFNLTNANLSPNIKKT